LNIAGDTKQLKSNRAFQNVKVITLAMKLGVIFSNLLIGRLDLADARPSVAPVFHCYEGKMEKR